MGPINEKKEENYTLWQISIQNFIFSIENFEISSGGGGFAPWGFTPIKLHNLIKWDSIVIYFAVSLNVSYPH